MTASRIGTICLGLFLIGYAIGQFTNIEFTPIILAILAIIAGIIFVLGLK